ncbi:MAG: hypothetical protein U0996_06105 [Planctomycetaceae bacterium]
MRNTGLWLVLSNLVILGCGAGSDVVNDGGNSLAALPAESTQIAEPSGIRRVECRWLHPSFGERKVEVVVFSGDMICVTLFAGEPPYFVTIENFDAPELDQPFGAEAADRLAEILSTERISAGPATKEAQKQLTELQRIGNGKELTRVDLGRPSWALQLHGDKPKLVAEVLTEEGLGWWNGNLAGQTSRLMRSAFQAKKGIWVKQNVIAPWVWRELTEVQKKLLR